MCRDSDTVTFNSNKTNRLEKNYRNANSLFCFFLENLLFHHMLDLFHSIFLCLFQVYSGYRFVLRASEMKKPISLLGIGPTRADKLADLKIDAKCSDVFNQVNI